MHYLSYLATREDLKDEQHDKKGDVAVFKGKVANCSKAGLGIYDFCADNGGPVKNCLNSEKISISCQRKILFHSNGPLLRQTYSR